MTDLTAKRGIHLEKRKDLCFIEDHILFTWTGSLLTIGDYFTIISQYQTFQGAFYHAEDNKEQQEQYLCEGSQRSTTTDICATNDLIAVTSVKASFWRTLLFHNVRKATSKLEKTRTLLTAIERRAKSRHFEQGETMELESYLAFSSSYLAPYNVTKSNWKNELKEKNQTELEVLFHQANNKIPILADWIGELNQGLEKLLANRFPPEIFSISHIQEKVHAILRTKKKTFFINRANVGSIIMENEVMQTSTKCETTCATKIQLSIPLTSEEQRMQVTRVTGIPFLENKNEWKRMDVPHTLINGSKGRFTMDYTPTSILEDDNCLWISTTSLQQPTTCALQLLDDKAPDQCIIEDVTPPEETAIPIQENKFIFNDPDSGTLTETCNNTRTVQKIPHSGLITFNPECRYEIVDGPWKQPPTGIDATIFQDINTFHVDQDNNPMDQFKKHFQQHGPIYIISLTGLFLLTIIMGTIMYSYHRRCCRPAIITLRRERRRQRTSDDSANVIEMPGTSQALVQPSYLVRGNQITRLS